MSLERVTVYSYGHAFKKITVLGFDKNIFVIGMAIAIITIVILTLLAVFSGAYRLLLLLPVTIVFSVLGIWFIDKKIAFIRSYNQVFLGLLGRYYRKKPIKYYLMGSGRL